MFANERVGWALAKEGLLHTSDGGNTWEAREGTGGDAMWVFGENNIIVCRGSLWRTKDGGDSWELLNKGLSGENWCGGFFFHDRNRGWLVKRKWVWRTEDGGRTWELSSLRLPEDAEEGKPGLANKFAYGLHHHLRAIYFSNENVGFAVGGYYDDWGETDLSARSMIVSTFDGGETWEIHKQELGCLFGGIVGIPDGPTWFLASGEFVVFNESWPGNHWYNPVISNTEEGRVRYSSYAYWTHVGHSWDLETGFFFDDAMTGWVAGRRVFHTTDGGKNWTEEIDADQNIYIFDMKRAGNRLVAVGWDGRIFHRELPEEPPPHPNLHTLSPPQRPVFLEEAPQLNLPEDALARLGKGGFLGWVAYSPDGSLLAVATTAGVWLHDPHTGEERDFIAGFPPRGMIFSPDGTLLASMGAGRKVHLWDVENRKLKSSWSTLHTKPATLSISHDGKFLATAGWDKPVAIWDLGTGEHISDLDQYGSRVQFSPTKNCLAVANNNSVVLWDIDTLKKNVSLTIPYVRSLSFSPDGTLLSSSGDGQVTIWEVTTGEEKHVLNFNREDISFLAFSPDGETLAASADRQMYLLDPKTGETKTTLPDYGYMAWASDGNSLSISEDGVRIWDIETERQKIVLGGYTKHGGMKFSPDGKILASLGGGIHLWDTETWEVTAVLEDAYGVHSLNWISDNRLVVGASRGFIRLWNVDTKTATSLRVPTTKGPGITVSADGTVLAANHWDGNNVWILDMATKEIVDTLVADASAPRMVLSPDGSALLFVYGWTAVLWDLSTVEEQFAFEHTAPIFSAEFSPDGTLLAVGGEEVLTLWDLETMQGKAILEGHTKPIRSLVWSADSRTLISAGEDRQIRLWDVESEELMEVMEGHASEILSLSLSPEGILASSGEGIILLWSNPHLRIPTVVENTPVTDVAAGPGAYPNPFNSTVTLTFSAPTTDVAIFNLSGQKVRSLETVPLGSSYQAQWDGRDNQGIRVASGVYLYRAPDTPARKMLLIR